MLQPAREAVDRSGISTYSGRSFEAPQFRTRLKSLYKRVDDQSAATLTSDELRQHKETLTAEVKEPQAELPTPQSGDAVLLKGVLDLCRRPLAVETIDALAKDTDVADWVRSGLALHEKKKASNCLYCAQTIPPERIDALKRHFDTAYQTLLTDIGQAWVALRNVEDECDQTERAIPSPDAITATLRKEVKEAAQALHTAIESRRQVIHKARKQLETRRADPLVDFEPLPLEPVTIAREINAVNEVLQRHKSAVDNRDALVKDACDRIVDHVVAGYMHHEEALTAKQSRWAKVATCLKEWLRDIDQSIATLDKEVKGHAHTANELTSDLKDYLGHGDLSLVPVDVGYKLQRRGVDAPVSSLSEGEKTGLAVLYFLRSLDAEDRDPTRSVVVVDDPVSSLDSSALYAAITFICHKLDDAGQVILLTHSFTAFREWKKWAAKKGEGGAAFFQCKAIVSDDGRHSTIGLLDALLENYESEYHYLFHYIVRAADDDLVNHELLPLANVARRVLEAFLAFRRPRPAEGKGSGQGKRSMDLDLGQFADRCSRVKPSEVSRLERFVNTFSHNDTIAVPGSDRTPTGEAKQIAEVLMDFMADLDQEHVDEMKLLVNPPMPASVTTLEISQGAATT